VGIKKKNVKKNYNAFVLYLFVVLKLAVHLTHVIMDSRVCVCVCVCLGLVLMAITLPLIRCSACGLHIVLCKR